MFVGYRDNIAPELIWPTPAAGSYKATSQLLEWAANDGFDTPVAHFKVTVNNGVPIEFEGDQTSFLLSDLPAGPNEVELEVVDLEGNLTSLPGSRRGVITGPGCRTFGPSDSCARGDCNASSMHRQVGIRCSTAR